MRKLDLAVLLLAVGAVAGAAWWRFHVPTATPPPAPWRCDSGKDARWDCFVPVPGGTFLMGAQATEAKAPGYDADASPNEGPPRMVSVSPFWIGRGEMSVGVFRECARAGKCDVADVATEGGYSTWAPLDAPDVPTSLSRPLNGVSWKGARDTCAFVGGRLPTEAEWEFAARGTDGRHWPWGNQPLCASPPKDDPFTRTQEDTKTCTQDGPWRMSDMPNPSPFGLVGMAGNLWEWVGDWYAPDGLPAAGSKDPSGPATGETRGQRGGSWTASSPADLRVTVRGGLDPESKLNDVGFRCVFGGADVR